MIGVLCLIGLFGESHAVYVSNIADRTVYESYANLKEPLIPMHFFKDRGYVASMISLSLGASVYYSQAIIWPAMAANVYGEGRIMWAGWVGCLAGLGITIGEMIGGGLAKAVGWTKWQCVFVFSAGTLLLGCMFYDDVSLPPRC